MGTIRDVGVKECNKERDKVEKEPQYLHAQHCIGKLESVVDQLEGLVVEMYEGPDTAPLPSPSPTEVPVATPRVSLMTFIMDLPGRIINLEDRIRGAINQIKQGM